MDYYYQSSMGKNTIEEMLDKTNIRETIEFERYCRDYGHFKEERSLYHDDAIVWTSWYQGSVDGFIAASAHRASIGQRAKHKINNTLVWLNGDRAVAECICMLQFREKLGEELVDLDVWCRLHFRLERREDRVWKICAFQGIFEKDRMVSAFNDGRWQVQREDLMKFRPCFWNQMYRLHVHKPEGNKPQDDSVGEDRPEMVQKLYEETSNWFNGN